MDTSTHDKLFSSSAEFYQRGSTRLPDSVHSLDLNSALTGIEAVVKSKMTSVASPFRPSGQFARRSVPRPPKSRSPSPSTRPKGKIEKDELQFLEQLDQKFDYHHAQIFNGDFASLSYASQCVRMDEATAWLQVGLQRLDKLDERSRERQRKAVTNRVSMTFEDTSTKDKRAKLRERMRSLHAKICALYAPIIPEIPVPVDAGEYSLFRYRLVVYTP
jgi:hypothetical protein